MNIKIQKFMITNHLYQLKELRELSYLENLDINILYYSTIKPFDKKSLNSFGDINKIILVHELYIGSLVSDISNNFFGKVKIFDLGLPLKFFNNYGSEQDNYEKINFNSKKIFFKIKKIITSK